MPDISVSEKGRGGRGDAHLLLGWRQRQQVARVARVEQLVQAMDGVFLERAYTNAPNLTSAVAGRVLVLARLLYCITDEEGRTLVVLQSDVGQEGRQGGEGARRRLAA